MTAKRREAARRRLTMDYPVEASFPDPGLTVDAVRDDGALLVTSGPAAVVVTVDGGTWVISRDVALSRGRWVKPSGQALPDLDRSVLAKLSAYRAELEIEKLRAVARQGGDQ